MPARQEENGSSALFKIRQKKWTHVKVNEDTLVVLCPGVSTTSKLTTRNILNPRPSRPPAAFAYTQSSSIIPSSNPLHARPSVIPTFPVHTLHRRPRVTPPQHSTSSTGGTAR
jgi:hypothetical protein